MSLRACPHCGCELEPTRGRSSRANRYYWGVVVKAFQDIWSRGRIAAGLPPYTKDQTHSVLVTVLLGEEDGPMGKRVPVPTSIMDSREFWELTARARHFALQEYQAYIPEPNEPEEMFS